MRTSHNSRALAGGRVAMGRIVPRWWIKVGTGFVEKAPMRRRRTNPGKVIVYREAATFLREKWRWFVAAWSIAIALWLLIWALPYGSFAKGFHAGIVLMVAAGWTIWLLWYVSGLLPRLEGTWAEEWTGEALDKSSVVLERIASLRFDRFDVDQLAITRSGVLAIESKMRRYLFEETVGRDVADAAQHSRTVRHQLNTLPEAKQLGEGAVTAVLVYWGAGGREREPQTLSSSYGDVVVIGARHFDRWLSELGSGLVGPDYAKKLAREIESLATDRDRLQRPPGVVLRLLTRTR
jgi:hypothetical protein